MEIDASWYERPPGVPERLTAGGLVCALRDGQVVIALTREGDWPSYLISKGGVEAGETIEEAARREIGEEAGFTRLTLLGKVGVLERLTYDRAAWTVTHVFAYATGERDATPLDRAAHPHPPRWFRIDALPDILWPDQRNLIERSQKQLHHWLSRAVR